MQQLQMLKPKILEKLNQQIPNAGITDIYLRKTNSIPASTQATPAVSSPKLADIELSASEQQQITEKLTEIKDPDLHQELKRLLTRQKQLDKSRENHQN